MTVSGIIFSPWSHSYVNYTSTGLKAHWFRHSALVHRWRKAVHTHREEMYRTLKYFRVYKERWLARGDELDMLGSMGAAAYARRYAHLPI